jgi:hypothetical protein
VLDARAREKGGQVAEDPLGRPVVTADDLDRMTPQQVDDTWAASIVTDPDALPAEYVQTIRRRAAQRLAQREVPAAS